MKNYILENQELLKQYSFIKNGDDCWTYEEMKNNHVVTKIIFSSNMSTIYADNFADNRHYSGICETYDELDKILSICDIHQNLKLI